MKPFGFIRTHGRMGAWAHGKGGKRDRALDNGEADS
jgi:hypothetical protein